MKKNDLRVVKTLRQIDEALLTNIEQRPFREITLGMLCETALINKTTFYKYYQDKYDCLNRYLDRLLGEFRRNLDVDFILASPERIDEARYQQSFLRLAEYLYSRRREYWVIWEAQIDRRLFNEMIDALSGTIFRRAMMGCGELSEKRRSQLELYSRLFAVHTMSIFEWWFRQEEPVSAGEVLRLMTGNMKDGFFMTFRSLF